MGEIREVAVPDIGDFKDVPIIEVAVKVGDRVKAEAPLITLESDKASMEVPSPSAGIVKSLAVKTRRQGQLRHADPRRWSSTAPGLLPSLVNRRYRLPLRQRARPAALPRFEFPILAISRTCQSSRSRSNRATK